MSFADEIRSAATEAQGILGELGGAQPGKKNFVLNGVSYFGTVVERAALDPITGTGIESIKELVITATQSQFAAAPKAAPRSIVAAQNRNWLVVSVGNHPPLYEITCRPA
jgi:hypothetical protein